MTATQLVSPNGWRGPVILGGRARPDPAGRWLLATSRGARSGRRSRRGSLRGASLSTGSDPYPTRGTAGRHGRGLVSGGNRSVHVFLADAQLHRLHPPRSLSAPPTRRRPSAVAL